MSPAPPGPVQERRQAPRFDASMTLLNEVMRRPLDPGYAAAARRRAENPAAGATRQRQRVVTLLLATITGALLISAVVQLRLPSDVDSRGVLTEEVTERTAEVEALEAEVAALQAEIDGIGESALTGAGDQVVQRSQLLARTSGASAVVGPGVRIVVDDAEAVGDISGADPREQDATDPGRVRDRDLQAVVNGLWAAGAEAIAVNGQRLTVMSSIREAGSAVLVNFRPLVPPYEIEAIGDPGDLQVAFVSSPAGRYLAALENYGITTSIGGVDRLELPGASGLRLRYAEPLPAQPAPGASMGTQDGATDPSTAEPTQTPEDTQ